MNFKLIFSAISLVLFSLVQTSPFPNHSGINSEQDSSIGKEALIPLIDKNWPKIVKSIKESGIDISEDLETKKKIIQEISDYWYAAADVTKETYKFDINNILPI